MENPLDRVMWGPVERYLWQHVLQTKQPRTGRRDGGMRRDRINEGIFCWHCDIRNFEINVICGYNPGWCRSHPAVSEMTLKCVEWDVKPCYTQPKSDNFNPLSIPYTLVSYLKSITTLLQRSSLLPFCFLCVTVCLFVCVCLSVYCLFVVH